MDGAAGYHFSARAQDVPSDHAQLRMGYHPGYGRAQADDAADIDQEPALDDAHAAAATADGASARALQGRPGAPAARDGRSLQAQPREPGRRMPADAAAAADFHRIVRGVAQFGRTAPRAVHLVDQGPVRARLSAGVVDAAVAVHPLPWNS